MALGIVLRAPVKTCWKATQFLPPRPACPRPAELFHGLPATDDWRLLCARATLQCKADCGIPFMAGWASC